MNMQLSEAMMLWQKMYTRDLVELTVKSLCNLLRERKSYYGAVFVASKIQGHCKMMT
jgi:hypothetical protein